MTAATPTEALPAVIPVEQLETTRDPIVERALSIVVTDDATNEAAGAFLVEVLAPLEKEIHASTDPVCAATNTAHKAATTQRAELLAPVLGAEKIIKLQIGTYHQKRERERAAEARRIEADRKSEERRIEQARLKAEAAERERVRIATEAAETAQLERAAAAEQDGDHDAAERIATEEVHTPAMEPAYMPPEEPAMPARIASPGPAKLAGVGVRMKPEIEVVDFERLVRAIVAGGPKMPGFAVLDFSKSKLLAFVNSHGGKLSLPGVRIFEVPAVSKRGK